MKQLLRESPQGLIKFQMYSKKDEQRFTDRRLNRIKNKNTIPLGPWAHTVIEGIAITFSSENIRAFITLVWKVCENRLLFFYILLPDPKMQNFMMILIITNSIVLGVQAGEPPYAWFIVTLSFLYCLHACLEKYVRYIMK